jgi:hypothetical protein
MIKPVELLSNFKKFEELKTATLEYIEEIEKTYTGDRNQIPLQIDPRQDDMWHSVSWLKPGMMESDYNSILPRFKGSIFEELIDSMPTKVCRTRIMRLKDNTAYPIHSDGYPRIHVPIITHPECAFLFPDDDYMKTMLANGNVYWANVRKRHTFVNWGNQPRIHLLMSIVDKGYVPV